MRKRHTPEQIVRLLRQAEVEQVGGLSRTQICQKLGICEQTLIRWRQRYGGMGVTEARRLKALESENAQLKRLVAELVLDRQMLQDVVQKKF